MSLLRIITGCLLLSSTTLSAIHLTNNIELSGGYRQDDFKSGEDYFGFGEEGDPAGLTETDFTVKHANIWQIGGRARLVLPECCCNYGFLQNFYVKGFGYWGTDTGQTDFKDQYINVPEEQVAPTYGKLSHYRTSDWQIGLGYLLDLGCLCDCSDLGFAAGIIGGYSWNKQELKTKNGDSFQFDDLEEVINDPIYEGLKWSSRWEGWWVGGELYYAPTCDFLFNLGYEYHWSDWHGTFTPNQAALDVGGYTHEKRTTSKAHGNVVYLDTTYICDCWDIGLGFKWSYYKAKDAHVTEEEDTGLFPENGRGTWQTWQLTANLGFNF